ncbi:hypothetical protein KFL_000260410 [Klebsormidium nitens]|uniref:Uncharacterized protein n=1 Tax=Klebsormidium nitens TaxID=105231 RepID=A0A1Y1HKT6_KLENI|nr:hypothetical protein KFL_000260410 [Klebsormidium nitens]|eukprot:GAQ79225.1 hypothetical protein KFL_000260410 [Klebsormidium nitens]
MSSARCASSLERAQRWSTLQCQEQTYTPHRKSTLNPRRREIRATLHRSSKVAWRQLPGRPTTAGKDFYIQPFGQPVDAPLRFTAKPVNAVSQASLPGGSDSELRGALDLASDEELHEIVNILYGRSPLSPILKSIATGDGSSSDGEDGGAGHPRRDFRDMLSERETLLRRLEARFFFLAADAKATMTGKRPSYRQVLLCVRQKLRVPCSNVLSTADLEAEIFLHLLQEYSSAPSKQKEHEQGVVMVNDPRHVQGKRWHQLGKLLAPVKIGGEEVLSILAKGSSALGVTTLQNMALGRLSGRMLLERAKYQVATEALKKGGAAVANRIQSHYAVLAAKQALAGASARYAILRSTMTLLGPVMWGAFMADVVLQAVGTDYGRVVRVIFALAQIRLTRTYGWRQSDAT